MDDKALSQGMTENLLKLDGEAFHSLARCFAPRQEGGLAECFDAIMYAGTPEEVRAALKAYDEIRMTEEEL